MPSLNGIAVFEAEARSKEVALVGKNLGQSQYNSLKTLPILMALKRLMKNWIGLLFSRNKIVQIVSILLPSLSDESIYTF